MRVTRSHVLLAFGILAGGAGLAVIIEPEVLPPEIEQFRSMLDGQTVSRFALGLATFVVLVAIFRLLRAKPENVDRSSIAEIPPELVTNDGAKDVDQQARLAYERALSCFESPDHSTREVAIYGRRVERVIAVEPEIEEYLAELATTAAKTYATSIGCDEQTANRAIETGQWTDDRIAAAFLATDLDSDDSFTAWERFNAWLAPERAFEDRVRRVLDETERYAGTYLTYAGTADAAPRAPEQPAQKNSSGQPEATGRTDSGATARADGGNGPSSETDTRTSVEGGNHGE